MEQSVKQQKSKRLILIILVAVLALVAAGAIWFFSQSAQLKITSDNDIVVNFDNKTVNVKAGKPSLVNIASGEKSIKAREEKFGFKQEQKITVKSRFQTVEVNFLFKEKVREQEFIKRAKENNTIAAYKEYLEEFPQGKYAKQAEAGIKSITSEMDSELLHSDSVAYEKAKSIAKISAFEAYKEEFPKGIFVKEANEQIDILKQLDKEAYELAKKENTIAAFELYIKKNKEGLYLDAAKKNIERIKEEIERRKKDNAAFEKATKENTIASLKEYLKDFPKAIHKAEAEKIIKELEEEAYRRWVANEDPIWQKAVRTEKLSDYKRYIDEYPRGKYISEATKMYDLLEKERKFQLKAPPGFRYVEGGTFEMGSDKGSGDESPVHDVKLESFYMSKYEVTNEEYAKFLNEYGSDVIKGGEFKGQAMIYTDDWGVTFDGNQWKPQEGYEKHPVVYVTWYGAYEYCRYYGYRLPTEAEWEYAASGGIKSKKKTTFSGSNSPKAVAWYYETATTTKRVGRKGANELGLYDMTGNVWEWVNDWHEKNYYSRSPKINPKGPAGGSVKVLRGGSFFEITKKLRITYRDFSYPIIGYYNYGFRPVKEVL